MTAPASKLAQAMEREKAKFFRFVRKRLSRISFMDVEDIVADVVSGLLRRADVFGEVENAMAYAYRSLENRITDFRRKSRDTVSLSTEDGAAGPLAERLASPGPGPEGALANLEMRDRLIAALGRLSARERALWIATEIEGRGFRELSEEWGEPLGTLLSRKSRANARLREMLKDHRPD
jgi:RNA polymerase sigma factor (sigma-70 family)